MKPKTTRAAETAQNINENGWCPGRGSNPHDPFGSTDFKSDSGTTLGYTPVSSTCDSGISEIPDSPTRTPNGYSGGDNRKPSSMRGQGHVYLRGKYYWIKYHLAGKQFFESSKSQDEVVANRLLALRVNGFTGPVGGQVGDLIQSQAHDLSKLQSIAPGTLGALSELIVSSDLLTKGFEVFRSLSPSASCDLIAQRGDQIIRVEVKTVRIKGVRPVRPVVSNRNIFDVLAIVIKGRSIVYEPPIPGPTANQSGGAQ